MKKALMAAALLVACLGAAAYGHEYYLYSLTGGLSWVPYNNDTGLAYVLQKYNASNGVAMAPVSGFLGWNAGIGGFYWDREMFISASLNYSFMGGSPSTVQLTNGTASLGVDYGILSLEGSFCFDVLNIMVIGPGMGINYQFASARFINRSVTNDPVRISSFGFDLFVQATIVLPPIFALNIKPYVTFPGAQTWADLSRVMNPAGYRTDNADSLAGNTGHFGIRFELMVFFAADVFRHSRGAAGENGKWPIAFFLKKRE